MPMLLRFNSYNESKNPAPLPILEKPQGRGITYVYISELQKGYVFSIILLFIVYYIILHIPEENSISYWYFYFTGRIFWYIYAVVLVSLSLC
jgi:hypothetical protein